MNPFSFDFDGWLFGAAGLATVFIALVLAGRGADAREKRRARVSAAFCLAIGAFCTAVGFYGRERSGLNAWSLFVPLGGWGSAALVHALIGPAKPEKP